MKIIALTAENIKKLTAVEITPAGHIVQIVGKNGQGKTAVLDSIWWAIAGTEHIQSQPIRKGEKTARIKLDLGELKIERRFTEKNSYLVVENAEGARYPSPQKMLDGLIGALSFDPLAFARMEPRKQFDELRRISKIEVDLDALDEANKVDFANRTDINREARAKYAQAAAIVVKTDLPDAPFDENALLDRIQVAADENAQIEQRKVRRVEAVQTIKEGRRAAQARRERAAELHRQADEFENEAKVMDEEADGVQQRLDAAGALPAPTDISGLRRELDAAKATNFEIAKRKQRQTVETEAKALEAQAAALTKAMDGRAAAKMKAIAAAKLPVKDLGFGDGIVTLNGIPFEQASSSERLRVSLAVAMAANPKLRVIRIEDGSLLDEDSLAEIGAMAKDNDYQVWIERVDTSGRVGFIIEDGHVRGASTPAAAAE